MPSLAYLGNNGVCMCVFFLGIFDVSLYLAASIPSNLRWVHVECKSWSCLAEVFHEKAQKNEILKLAKLSSAEAKVHGLSEV